MASDTKTNKKSKFSQKKIRKIALTIFFIAFNVGVIVATAVNEFSGSQNAAELREVKLNGWLIIPAALCFMGMITLEFWKYAVMIIESTKPGTFTKKEAWKIAWRTVMIGRYYDRVTPAAVGGQPAQMLNLRRTGKIPAGSTTAIPIFGMISGQITFIIIAIPCFIVGTFTGANPVLMTTAWIGLAFYAFWPVMVVGSAISPKFTAKFINLFVNLLAKIKVIKNKDQIVKKVEDEVNEYTKNVKLIAKSPKVMLGGLLMSLFSNILVTFIPYYVLVAFGGNIDFMECFMLSMAIQSAVYYAPTPGNSGVAEGTFYVVFSRLSSGYVFWAMMLWRLFSYYIYIIIGPIIYFIMHLEKKREMRKEQDDHKE